MYRDLKINHYADKLAGFPILRKGEVCKLIKEIYQEGVKKGKRIKLYERKNKI